MYIPKPDRCINFHCAPTPIFFVTFVMFDAMAVNVHATISVARRYLRLLEYDSELAVNVDDDRIILLSTPGIGWRRHRSRI